MDYRRKVRKQKVCQQMVCQQMVCNRKVCCPLGARVCQNKDLHNHYLQFEVIMPA